MAKSNITKSFTLTNIGYVIINLRMPAEITIANISSKTHIYVDDIVVKSFTNEDFNIGNIVYKIDEKLYNISRGEHILKIELETTSLNSGELNAFPGETILNINSYVLAENNQLTQSSNHDIKDELEIIFNGLSESILTEIKDGTEETDGDNIIYNDVSDDYLVEIGNNKIKGISESINNDINDDVITELI